MWGPATELKKSVGPARKLPRLPCMKFSYLRFFLISSLTLNVVFNPPFYSFQWTQFSFETRFFLFVVEFFFDIVYVERMIGGVEKLFFGHICVLTLQEENVFAKSLYNLFKNDRSWCLVLILLWLCWNWTTITRLESMLKHQSRSECGLLRN